MRIWRELEGWIVRGRRRPAKPAIPRSPQPRDVRGKRCVSCTRHTRAHAHVHAHATYASGIWPQPPKSHPLATDPRAVLVRKHQSCTSPAFQRAFASRTPTPHTGATHTRAHTHTRERAHTRTRTRTHARARTHTDADTQTHRGMRMCKHASTHTQSQARIRRSGIPLSQAQTRKHALASLANTPHTLELRARHHTHEYVCTRERANSLTGAPTLFICLCLPACLPACRSNTL